MKTITNDTEYYAITARIDVLLILYPTKTSQQLRKQLN